MLPMNDFSFEYNPCFTQSKNLMKSDIKQYVQEKFYEEKLLVNSPLNHFTFKYLHLIIVRARDPLDNRAYDQIVFFCLINVAKIFFYK